MKQLPLRTALIAAFILAMLLLPAAVSAMDASIRIFVDGDLLETEHQPTFLEQSPYVTPAFLQDELEVLAVWDNESRTLALERGTYQAQFVIHESHAVVNDEVIRLSSPPIVLYNEIYLPAVEVGEALGFQATWDVVNHTLQFYSLKDSEAGTSKRPNEIVVAGSGDPQDVTDTGEHAEDNARHDQAGSEALGDEFAEQHSDQPEIPVTGRDEHSGVSMISKIESVAEQIVIQGDGPLEAEVFTLSDPHRLVIDIANSKISPMLNGSPSAMFGQVDSTHPQVERIRYALFSSDPDITRLVIDLRQPVQYSLTWDRQQEKISIDIRGQNFQVVLDAGHGGKDPGAITYSNYYEKDFTLPLTLKIYELLQDEPFIKPVLTRSDDTFIELDERSAIANRIDADLFVSIHGNTYIPSIHGTETYYYDEFSKAFAETMHRHVVEATGFRDRQVRQREYKVLRLAEMPAALIEIGYVSNKEQEALLYNDEFQDKIAQAIVDGIKQYLQIHD